MKPSVKIIVGVLSVTAIALLVVFRKSIFAKKEGEAESTEKGETNKAEAKAPTPNTTKAPASTTSGIGGRTITNAPAYEKANNASKVKFVIPRGDAATIISSTAWFYYVAYKTSGGEQKGYVEKSLFILN